MEGLHKAAQALRDWLADQPWLAPLEPLLAQTPDGALLAGPAAFVVTVLALAMILRPRRSRKPARPQATAQSAEPQRSPGPPPGARSPEGAAAPTTTISLRTTGLPSDSDQDRGVRVFVSSTFLDMRGERDELTKTFIDLRRRFRERGVELLEVDLRWGVSEQDVTLDVCLSEVNRCKPYFLGLLGERYGTRLTDAELTPELLDDYPALQGAVGRSLTEIEIIQGVLSDPGAATRALFFERDPAWLDTLDPTERATFEEASEDARAKLADLKARIRSSGARVHAYPRPEAIGAAVEAALGATLEASFPETDAPDAFTQTHRLHAAYARDRLGPHIGAEPYLDQLDRWMSQAEAAPVLITGASGGGKSKLIAKWLQARRAKSGDDIVFAHYLGASPESADPMQVMRRLWEHLNRATGETVELPGGNADLMDMAGGLGLRLAQASAFAQRNDGSILIALDGLDKLAGERSLRWLPSVLPPRVKLVASSLDGEAKDAALARGWTALEVKPLDAAGQSAFIAATLTLWGKRDLPPARKQRLLAHPLAGLPLFLKTVLEELRVSATEAVLDARLGDYLQADDMPALFARVLERLERASGQALVAQALSLIEASRAGLEETEIIAITGATPLAWATLRNALGDNLRDQAGRVAFAHDYLSQAVQARYLATDDARRAAHLDLADRFDARAPDERQAEELPYQLEKVGAWERLEALLLDLDRFKLLRARGDGELLSYWLLLEQRGRDLGSNLVSRYLDCPSPKPIEIGISIGSFMMFAGTTNPVALRLYEAMLDSCTIILGPKDRVTLMRANDLGEALRMQGKLIEAKQILERAFRQSIDMWGQGDDAVITLGINLGSILYQMALFNEAQRVQSQTLANAMKFYGSADRRTIFAAQHLAATLHALAKRDEAKQLLIGALEASRHSHGEQHIDTLLLKNTLLALSNQEHEIDDTLIDKNDICLLTKLLGPSHPITTSAMFNLGQMLAMMEKYSEALDLLEKVFDMRRSKLGLDHPDTLAAMNDFALVLSASGAHEHAEKLLSECVGLSEAALGIDHPHTLKTMANYAGLLSESGDENGARELLQDALSRSVDALGELHPDSITHLSNLATHFFNAEEFELARDALVKVLRFRTETEGPAHAEASDEMIVLAETHSKLGDIEGRNRILRRNLEARRQIYGSEDELGKHLEIVLARSARGV